MTKKEKSMQGTGANISITTNSSKNPWQYLESRPDSWRQQLYVIGKKLKAFDVWIDMMVNRETPQEAAENWALPLEAVMEAIEYCETHQELLTSCGNR